MQARWRGCKNEFAAYERFLAHLEEAGLFLCERYEGTAGAFYDRTPKSHRQVVAQVLQIDLEQLDRERAALLDVQGG